VFREQAGDLRMADARQRKRALEELAQSRPNDAAAAANLDKAQRDYLEFELEEFKLRVEAYPTDLGRKYALGEKYFNLGLMEESIALFQESQNDPRLRGQSLKYLGRSFLKIGWIGEAIETFRRALDARDVLPDLAIELKYDLMLSLLAKARQDRDIGAAEEADKIASSIAIQQITYRDIRARREELKKLIGDLRAGGSAPAPPSETPA
jgi:tetratricopeptide (TPR) repeat protein